MEVQFTRRRSSRPARFPNAIRDYRLNASLSQKHLGELIGRSRYLVSAWERGQRLPSLPNVFRLARALGTLAESLYSSLYHANLEKPTDNPDKK